MSDYCTIYCSHPDYSGIAKLAHKVGAKSVHIVGTDDNWDKILLTGANSVLTLTGMMQKEPGDNFSQLILGTFNYFRNIATEAIANRNKVLEVVSNSRFAVGIVAVPSFSEEDDFATIFSIAELMSGLIFNGSGMVDHQGKMVLDGDGSYDTLLI